MRHEPLQGKSADHDRRQAEYHKQDSDKPYRGIGASEHVPHTEDDDCQTADHEHYAHREEREPNYERRDHSYRRHSRATPLTCWHRRHIKHYTHR